MFVSKKCILLWFKLKIEICINCVKEIHNIFKKMHKLGLAAIHPGQNKRIKGQGVLQTSWTTIAQNLKHFTHASLFTLKFVAKVSQFSLFHLPYI